MTKQFCGRKLDTLTMAYKTSDGSGEAYPVEMEQEVLEQLDGRYTSGCRALCTLFAWKERLAAAPKPESEQV